SDQAQKAPTVEHLLRFLRDRTGYRIEGRTLRSYGLVVEEIASGQCEVAFLTAASYARARYATEGNDDPDDDIEAFLQVVRRGSPDVPGSDLAYRAAIIVRADSPIRSLEDLGPKTVVALGPRTSGAGSILPTALFQRMGLAPRIQRYEGSYPFIVSSVPQGAADAGSIWWSPPNEELPHNDARITIAEAHPDVFERTRIIGYTAWLPNEPVVIRKVVPEAVKRTLARALCLYISLLTLTPEGRKELTSVGSAVGLIPASNDDFLPLMEVIEQAFADDPEGRRDFMAGRK
ncbi:MAG: PhnD/SsuA/transferrin family substrate-binding protein, partial [Planctomycetota bacterium]